MAEEKDEKELELEATAEGEEGGKPKSKKKLIMMLAAVVLLGGGAGAYFFLFAGGSDGDTEEMLVEEEVMAPAEYKQLKPPFIVNFPDRGRQRFLQADITLMTREPDVLFAIDEHMPLIRHNLTNVLSAQSLTTLHTAAGIERLRREATEELKRILAEEIGTEEGIDEVLFTSFVLQ